MDVCYYYQTFVGLHQILTHIQDITLLIVSSIHFDDHKIYLNNNEPHDPMFDPLWSEIQQANYEGVDIHLMVGGAGGAYQALFSEFEIYYPLLTQMIRERPYIQGVNLDIEESVKLNDVQSLIRRLKTDFGSTFQITMAPVQLSMMSDSPGMGGFSYKDLYVSDVGPWIDTFNVQCYDSFSYETFRSIVDNGYPPEKIIMGMMSGQFTKDTFEVALSEVRKIKTEYPTFKGVYDWEYMDAPPGGTRDPSEFATLFSSITSHPVSEDGGMCVIH